MFCYHLVLFQQVPLLHFQHLTAVVCPYGLYLGLQCFDGFFKTGLPPRAGRCFSRSLDLVCSRKENRHSLGDVGGCGRGCPFSRSVCISFSPVQALPVRSFRSCNSTASVFSSSVCRFMSRRIHVHQSWKRPSCAELFNLAVHRDTAHQRQIVPVGLLAAFLHVK